MAVNVSSLAAKLNAYANSGEGRARIASKVIELRRSGGMNTRTEAGDLVISFAQIQAAAADLVSMVRKHAASAGLPASVMADVESLQQSGFTENEDGSVHVELTMTADKSRASVQPEKYDGSYNIVAAFNKGYNASGSIRGYWESAGEEVWTRQSRQGLYFLQAAIAEFSAKYGAEYKVTVKLSGEYE